MTGADGEFVDADDLGCGEAGAVELFGHVLFVEVLDGVPVKVEVFGDILDRGQSAVAADADGEAMSVTRVVGEPVEVLALHGITQAASDATDRPLEVNAPAAGIEVADQSSSLVVEVPVEGATDSADRFFERRRSGITTA